MNKNNVMVITDVDGTILSSFEREISEINRTAAQKLVDAGVLLTLATGRGNSASCEIHRSIGANLPAVLYNGSCVYDFEKGKSLFELYQPRSAVDLIKEVMEKFTACGVVMSDVTQDYIVRVDEDTMKFLKAYGSPYDYARPSDAQKMLKILISCGLGEADEIYSFVQANLSDELTTTKSGGNYIEILPKGSSKAAGLQKLSEIIDMEIRDMVAIGDYHNDIEMLKAVGTPVTVKSAPQEVKEVCKYIVSDPEHGSLADLFRVLSEVHGFDTQ